ncbi:EexN family lipoprotein [Mannheimia sp. AT1]|uniref:EexN family lipoprotein n=1 Tax=Mannheimia cairinae TaxID=3025936 RepID=A0ABT5MTF1_9PAST|nr:EexN family lipoprotein [Mannheimia cairinae]MDD0824891.1 EexN family lipoprotein [Mannheimia cairinae]MDD0826179.1 EexN family lipoprotein [Mannheimia cairinae]
MKKIILLCFSFIFLSACNEKTHTVDEFMKDENLRNSFLAKCDNGELHNQDLNCLNSRKAEQNKTMLDSLTDDKL